MVVSTDLHVHTNYSDGGFLEAMIDAAEEAGLTAIGFADHCNVSAREPQRREKYRHGFSFDLTYERRRRALEDLREETDLRLLDGVEMDYDPREESTIETFLEAGEFAYSIGSVHHVADRNVNKWGEFADDSTAECEAVVETYVENLISLIESDLFDVVAHLDLPERNPHLRGYMTTDAYGRIAKAFDGSETVPEINAGRVDAEYGEFHPAPAFLDVLLEWDVRFVLGSDAHRPDRLRDRIPELKTLLADRGLDPIDPGRILGSDLEGPTI